MLLFNLSLRKVTLIILHDLVFKQHLFFSSVADEVDLHVVSNVPVDHVHPQQVSISFNWLGDSILPYL